MHCHECLIPFLPPLYQTEEGRWCFSQFLLKTYKRPSWIMFALHLCTELIRVHHQYQHPPTEILITAITSHFRDNKSFCFLSPPIVLFQREDLHGIRLQTFNCSMTLQYRIHISCCEPIVNCVTRLRRHVTRVTWHCVTTRDWCDVMRREVMRHQRPITGHGGWKSENNIPGDEHPGIRLRVSILE